MLNRHVCALCRLQKCFYVGMTSILFRGSNSKNQTTESSNNNQILQVKKIIINTKKNDLCSMA